MTIFISYSHADKAVVNNLAAHMVKCNAQVWVDTWELNVGDSIIQRVQEAITSSDALLVVLSKASVESEWCKKELASGLIRELDERRVVVLPVLVEDCEIPLFLRDKMYADIRDDFEGGLNAIMDAVARVSNPHQSRVESDEGFTDWAMDWGETDGLYNIRFTIVNSVSRHRITFLTEVTVMCDAVITARQHQYIDADLEWFGHMTIAEALFEFGDQEDIRVILDSQFPQEANAAILDKKRGAGYAIHTSCRKLGEDNGKNQVVNISDFLKLIREYLRSTTRKPTTEEYKKIVQIMASPFGTEPSD